MKRQKDTPLFAGTSAKGIRTVAGISRDDVVLLCGIISVVLLLLLCFIAVQTANGINQLGELYNR